MDKLPDFLWRKVAPLWHQPGVGVGFAITAVLSVLVVRSGDDARGISLLTAVLALGVFCLALAFWWYTNKLPRNTKGKVGIAIAILADEEKEARQIEFDFVRVLRQLLHRDPGGANFNVVVLPPHAAARITDPVSARQLVVKARCHLMIYGQAKLRHQGGKPCHVLSLEGVVRHAPIPTEISKGISADFRQALPHRLLVAKDSDAIAFEITSAWVDLSARFVIGIAAHLSGAIEYAEALLLHVEGSLKTAQPAALLLPMYGGLPERLKAVYRDWLSALSDQYFRTRRKEFVHEADPICDKLLARDPDDYNALLFKAIAEFVLRRDVVAAKAIIGKCRRIRDATWRYSLAFLHAYCGDLELAHNEYRRAFRGRISSDNVAIQTEEFIQIVIDEEPQSDHLYFCLGLINYNAKRDYVAATRDFERFVQSPSIGQYPWAKRKAEDLLVLSKKHSPDETA